MSTVRLRVGGDHPDQAEEQRVGDDVAGLDLAGEPDRDGEVHRRDQRPGHPDTDRVGVSRRPGAAGDRGQRALGAGEPHLHPHRDLGSGEAGDGRHVELGVGLERQLRGRRPGRARLAAGQLRPLHQRQVGRSLRDLGHVPDHPEVQEALAVRHQRRAGDQVQQVDRDVQRRRTGRGDVDDIGEGDPEAAVHAGGQRVEDRDVGGLAPAALQRPGRGQVEVAQGEVAQVGQTLDRADAELGGQVAQGDPRVDQALVPDPAHVERVVEQRAEDRGVAAVQRRGVRPEAEAGVLRGPGQGAAGGCARSCGEGEVHHPLGGDVDPLWLLAVGDRQHGATSGTARHQGTVGAHVDVHELGLHALDVAEGGVVARHALGHHGGQGGLAATTRADLAGRATVDEAGRVQGDHVRHRLHVAADHPLHADVDGERRDREDDDEHHRGHRGDRSPLVAAAHGRSSADACAHELPPATAV